MTNDDEKKKQICCTLGVRSSCAHPTLGISFISDAPKALISVTISMLPKFVMKYLLFLTLKLNKKVKFKSTISE
jgi:hypothetical protein